MSFVLLFGLGSVSDSLITVLVGDKWLEGAEYLRIIVITASLYPLHAINLNMLQVQGRSDLFLKLEILKKIIGIGPLLLGIFVNIKWMLWGSVAAGVFDYFLNSYYSGKFIGYSTRAQIKDILPSLCIASVMCACVFALTLLDLRPIWMLLVQLCAGAAIAIGLSEAFRLPEYKELKTIVINALKKDR